MLDTGAGALASADTGFGQLAQCPVLSIKLRKADFHRNKGVVSIRLEKGQHGI